MVQTAKYNNEDISKYFIQIDVFSFTVRNKVNGVTTATKKSSCFVESSLLKGSGVEYEI